MWEARWLSDPVVPSSLPGAHPMRAHVSDFVEKERFCQTFAFLVLTAEALFTGTLT